MCGWGSISNNPAHTKIKHFLKYSNIQIKQPSLSPDYTEKETEERLNKLNAN